MGKGIYEKQYCKNEWNFEIQTDLSLIPNGNIILSVGECAVEVEVFGTDFTTSSGNATTVTVDVVELDNLISSGGEPVVLNVDFLRANRDRESLSQEIECVDAIKGTLANPIVFDSGSGEAGLNILRSSSIISKNIPSFQPSPQVFFKYSLKRNTDYLIKTTSLTNTEISYIFGLIREL